MTQEPRIVLVCPFFVKPQEINKQRYYKPFYNNINKLPENLASHLKSPFVPRTQIRQLCYLGGWWQGTKK